MIINGRTLIIQPVFTEQLDEIVAYLEDYSFKVARSFVLELNDFLLKKIAPQPEWHSEYAWKRTPERMYRRAIFRKKYYVIFKILPTELHILAIVYSRRDLNSLSID